MHLRWKSPCTEGFIGTVNFCQSKVELPHKDTIRMTNIDRLLTGDSLQSIVLGSSPDLGAPDDEEVDRIACLDETSLIQHQGFVDTHCVGVDASLCVGRLGYVIPLLVFNIGRPAAYPSGSEHEASLTSLWVSGLDLWNDDEEWRAAVDRRVLIRR